MATKVTMPQMGFDMTEGKVARWLKQVGDPIKQGEAVVEIETDKVNIESEATGNGVLREILVSDGTTVPVGTMIAIIGAPDEDLTAIKAEAGFGAPAEPAAPAAAEAPAKPEATKQTPSARTIETAPTAAPAPAPVQAGNGRGDGRIKASPLAKRIAQEKGVSLAQLTGTGPGGRIVKRDVETATPAVAAAPEGFAQPIAAMAQPGRLGPSVLKAEEVTPTKLRQTIAKRMVASKQTVPHFYVTSEIDMEAAMELRGKLNTLVDEAGKISVNDLVLKAAAIALTHFPGINASFGEKAIVRHGTVNLGIAVALEQGLITVVVTDTDRKPLAQIAREAKDIVNRAKNGKARPEELQGSTFTVSNLGMFDVEEFVAIINPPEAAILAVGSVKDVPVVKDGQIVPGKTMKITLSADHRVTDGAEAAKFLQEVKQNLEEPLRLMI
ncbi:pyruvate dehydrogenase E2 component (dihydrolipoamide acetyltransferase) [Thermoflexales bacterium]|nr:pyruvate dehydrogenase E2 component (dihydrolipoamide acetyltransferase) [Thermoflexales bacterium]